MYVARPYNFNLSPLLTHGDKLGVYRDITFSTSSIHFLQKHGLDIGAVFTKGVPYLSREEQAFALQNYDQVQENRLHISDILISPDDIKVLEFYRMVRATVSSLVSEVRMPWCKIIMC